MLAGLLGGRLVQFMLGPAGRIVLLALAFGAWTLYQRYDATRDCEADNLREELIESQRQLEIAQGIAEDARERANQTEQEMAETERRYDELTKDLLDRPETACRLDPDTRKRLLAIE